jgi:hypothetical protein
MTLCLFYNLFDSRLARLIVFIFPACFECPFCNIQLVSSEDEIREGVGEMCQGAGRAYNFQCLFVCFQFHWVKALMSHAHVNVVYCWKFKLFFFCCNLISIHAVHKPIMDNYINLMMFCIVGTYE